MPWAHVSAVALVTRILSVLFGMELSVLPSQTHSSSKIYHFCFFLSVTERKILDRTSRWRFVVDLQIWRFLDVQAFFNTDMLANYRAYPWAIAMLLDLAPHLPPRAYSYRILGEKMSLPGSVAKVSYTCSEFRIKTH